MTLARALRMVEERMIAEMVDWKDSKRVNLVGWLKECLLREREVESECVGSE